METDIRAVVLLLAPVLAVFLAYRAHLAERRQTSNLAFLHEASRALASASGAAAGVAGLLTLALDNFRGEVAEVCLFAADGEGEASRISVGGPRGLEVMAPLDARVARELRELMDRDSAARLVTPEDVGGALAGHLRALGVQSAMLAPLPGTRRMVGTMMLADRSGLGGSFGRSEITLFDTLAHQTGAALGQDRMTTKVDELKELQVELERKAFHDPLTGLANRLLFMNRVDFVLKRRTGNAAVIYIDLDNFKPINDTYGHEAGDAVLKAAGERLVASLRPSDTAARLGGDEFAVLLVDIPEEHIGVVADRIVGNLTQAARVRRPRARGRREPRRRLRRLRHARRRLARPQRRRRDVRRQARRQGPAQRVRATRARRRLEPLTAPSGRARASSMRGAAASSHLATASAGARRGGRSLGHPVDGRSSPTRSWQMIIGRDTAASPVNP